MLKRTQPESQQEPNPCTIYTYNSPATFEFMFSSPSALEHLERQEYQELPGSFGIVRSFALLEGSRLAHKFCVLISHPEQDYLFLLRDFQYAEFMQKCACVAPIIQTYLPHFQGQAMLKRLPS
jgi:hypothetical protein